MSRTWRACDALRRLFAIRLAQGLGAHAATRSCSMLYVSCWIDLETTQGRNRKKQLVLTPLSVSNAQGPLARTAGCRSLSEEARHDFSEDCASPHHWRQRRVCRLFEPAWRRLLWEALCFTTAQPASTPVTGHAPRLARSKRLSLDPTSSTSPWQESRRALSNGCLGSASSRDPQAYR